MKNQIFRIIIIFIQDIMTIDKYTKFYSPNHLKI